MLLVRMIAVVVERVKFIPVNFFAFFLFHSMVPRLLLFGFR